MRSKWPRGRLADATAVDYMDLRRTAGKDRRVALGKAVAALVAGCLFTAAAPPAGPQVKVGGGWLEGAVASGVASFKNVPYAAPPVGPLRWRAPQPTTGWRGVRSATVFGPACTQTHGASGYRGAESEDCLTLNVWTPAGHLGGRLPVMVWIHGGGFIGGSGASYDGTRFAQDGIVLVTINYRLGRLGFFAHPALAKTNPEGGLADFGLMDQIAALKWVKANIRAFGGDPGNVTVFGESAGGVSVDYLLISPLARGLFVKAISESNFARVPGKSLAQAQKQAARYGQTLGVDADDAAAAEALRALPSRAFSTPAGALTDPEIPGPIIDNVVTAQTVSAAFAKGDQARVAFIVGGNSFEASLFSIVKAHPEAVVATLGGGDHDKVAAQFGDGDPVAAAANLITLSYVIEPDRYLARQEARVGTPAFVYYFSYVPQAMRASTLGAGHGAEVSYVFDTLPKVAIDRAPDDTRLGPTHIPAATGDDENISRAMHAYWVAFAKTGDPGDAGGPRWPSEKAADGAVLEFGADGPQVRRDFDKAKLDFLEARTEAADASSR
jgi:para-nitrobenzyl esterase